MRFVTTIFILFLMLPAQAQVLNLDAGIQLVSQKQVNIVLTGAGIRNEGIFIPDSSTVFMDGSNFDALTGSQPFDFFNLRLRGTGTKSNEGSANVFNGLGVEGASILDADGSLNDRTFTLKSSKIATAFVDKIIGGDITGNVTVERFINTGVATGEHGKSWQFLATPTSGQSIFEAWQEGGAAPSGFGTRISGNGLGFDVYSATPALKFYNPSSNGWTAVTNTFDPLQNANGYMLFVRGDRNILAFNDPANNTNMRSKGTLFRPLDPPEPVAVGPNQLQAFGNPYASRISFPEVLNGSSGIYDVFYAWDPLLNGSYGLGGYQTLSGTASYIPTAGDATVFYPAGVSSPNIESGQAVLVFAGAGGGSVNFSENVKVGGSKLVHRRPLTTDSLQPGKSLLISRLLTDTGQMADGNILVFQPGLGNHVNEKDAIKIRNGGENFGLMRDGKLLAVEGRESVTVTDTLFYYFTNLRPQEYLLQLQPVNMPHNLAGFFIDRYSNTSTPLNFNDSVQLRISFSNDAASRTADRFMIVFKMKQEEPFRFLVIDAWAAPRENKVWFKVNHENEVTSYTVEKSANGRQFRIETTLDANGSSSGTDYMITDRNPHPVLTYYRVKAHKINGEIHSEVVRVDRNRQPRFVAFPNPVKPAEAITFKISNIPQGLYTLSILNSAGQLVWQQGLRLNGDKSNHSVLNWTSRPGTYFVRLKGESNQEFITTLLVL